ncbi:MarR family transcriptional regulator [Paenibacillus sp. J31TS4]|uniref:MarR family winged helix-turn-helix transcriptional regulator n=1 Tax=Paenibacillus sp. J31TS4 TaxID=2807195 RepID=UPI001AFD31FA|nr:MarR family transcriptional regulator [Paenibacillus sp. J31TS4]GIP40415.1 MarR family transcriptional regulator [Paenibacillus sp. J31TS4]
MERFEGYSLSRVFRQVAKLHHHNLHLLLSDKGVFPGQPPLLSHLSEQDGLSQKELAEKMHNRPATVTVMLDRMEKAGLVERRTDPADHRVSRVHLTDRGREAHKETRKIMEAFNANLFEGFSEEEKQTMRQFLYRMVGNLHKMNPEEPPAPPSEHPTKE